MTRIGSFFKNIKIGIPVVTFSLYVVIVNIIMIFIIYQLVGIGSPGIVCRARKTVGIRQKRVVFHLVGKYAGSKSQMFVYLVIRFTGKIESASVYTDNISFFGIIAQRGVISSTVASAG